MTSSRGHLPLCQDYTELTGPSVWQVKGLIREINQRPADAGRYTDTQNSEDSAMQRVGGYSQQLLVTREVRQAGAVGF